MVAISQDVRGLIEQPDDDHQKNAADARHRAQIFPLLAPALDLRVGGNAVVRHHQKTDGADGQCQQHHDVKTVVLQRLHNALALTARRIFHRRQVGEGVKCGEQQ